MLDGCCDCDTDATPTCDDNDMAKRPAAVIGTKAHVVVVLVGRKRNGERDKKAGKMRRHLESIVHVLVVLFLWSKIYIELLSFSRDFDGSNKSE